MCIRDRSTSTPERNGDETAEETDAVRAREILAGMSLSEKVGQMFFVRCPESRAVEKVSQYAIGGYLLFARDFEPHTADSMRDVIQDYQNEAKIPLFIGVDEEGGTVTLSLIHISTVRQMASPSTSTRFGTCSFKYRIISSPS